MEYLTLLLLDKGDLFLKYDRVFVGYSGGLDSTVLLHQLAHCSACQGKLWALHVDHGLSLHSSSWRAHCQAFCDGLKVPLITRTVTITTRANLEEQARTARREVFQTLMSKHDCIVLAHHQDDQAETLLLQLFRGSGIDGMAAMALVTALPKGEMLRPFLEFPRAKLKAYAIAHQLRYVEDESNQDEGFSRNFLRHQVMPLIRQKWAHVSTNLARSAAHCQQAKENLSALAKLDYPLFKASKNTLDCSKLKTLSSARLVNVLRTWLQLNDVLMPSLPLLHRIIDEMIHAREDASPMVQWGTTVVRRYQQKLYVMSALKTKRCEAFEWSTFPKDFKQGSWHFTAKCAASGLRVPEGARLEIRFRKGGEHFAWHNQKKSLKKLWQQWQVPPWERDLIPLVYIDDCLAEVLGFAVSSHFSSAVNETSFFFTIKLELVHS